MSLSTQLTRGTLALPMLALFGVLALVAGRSVEARASPQQLPAYSQSKRRQAEPRELVLAHGQRLVLECAAATPPAARTPAADAARQRARRPRPDRAAPGHRLPGISCRGMLDVLLYQPEIAPNTGNVIRCAPTPARACT
jgi:hypothetical protein